MLKEIFESYVREHQSSGKFNISGVGGCWRKKWLVIKGLYKEEFDIKTLRNFDIGNFIHKQVSKELFEKGEQFNLRAVAGEISIPEQKYISGRVDLILSNSSTGELFIVDVKSASDYTLDKIRENNLDNIKNYIYQVQLYLHFFNIPKGFLLFFGKHKGEIEELEIGYDKELCLKLVKEIEDFFIDFVDKNIEPPKCAGNGFFPCPVCS